MVAPKSGDFTLLLQVYRLGLVRWLVSRDEVIAWADDIIKSTDDPDYFFIELSLSSTMNELIEILDRNIPLQESYIPARVILGLIYQLLFYGEIRFQDASKLVYTLQNQPLTSFEHDNFYVYEDDYPYYNRSEDEREKDLHAFLNTYRAFNLHNHWQWPQINIRVEEIIKQKEADVKMINKAYNKAWQKKRKKQKLKKQILRGIGIAGVFLYICSAIILLWQNGGKNIGSSFSILGILIFTIIMRWYGGRKAKKQPMRVK
ncbi:hypothetical protein [Mucilaginibacter sp. L196]|uniref:hypothetical protein n=1 Tax=Mucilaginibacter sp. L196 TaxID=1641870 RepID=UPI00131E373B|nr:hypothetical protein [Mucilaginibacter sp. L196]